MQRSNHHKPLFTSLIRSLHTDARPESRPRGEGAGVKISPFVLLGGPVRKSRGAVKNGSEPAIVAGVGLPRGAGLTSLIALQGHHHCHVNLMTVAAPLKRFPVTFYSSPSAWVAVPSHVGGHN